MKAPRLPGGVRRLTVVLVLSATADTFALVALLWYLTVSRVGAGALGLLVLAAGMPAVVTGPLIGRLLERLPVRKLIVADNLARAGVLAAIALLAAAGALGLPALLALAGLSGALSPVTYAGTRVLLPRMVGAEDLVRANRMLAIGDQFPLLAGPALAGPMAGLVGGPAALALPAAALAVAGWAAAGLRPGTANSSAPEEPRDTRWRSPATMALLLLTGAYYFAYGPLEPAMPLYARHVLHAGAAGYGALWAVFGLGALVGLLAVPRLARLRPGVVNAAGAAVWGLVTLPLTVISGLPAALAVMLAGGLVWGPYGAIEVAAIQAVTPPRRHGTVFGLRRAIQVAATPAGAAAGGVALARLAPQTVIGLAAGACVVAGLASLLYPPLRRLRQPDSSAAEVMGRSRKRTPLA